MIGSLVYILLDVSFNVLLWSGKKTIDGVTYVSSYAYNSLNTKENVLGIEPPHYNDVRREIEEEEKKEEERMNKENIIKMNEIKLLIEENEITMNKLKKILN